jgi:hypothetical protein
VHLFQLFRTAQMNGHLGSLSPAPPDPTFLPRAAKKTLFAGLKPGGGMRPTERSAITAPRK